MIKNVFGENQVLDVAEPPARSETADGAVVSAAPPSLIVMITTGAEVKVVPLGELEIADNKLIVYYHSQPRSFMKDKSTTALIFRSIWFFGTMRSYR
jgi:hypothetical protein